MSASFPFQAFLLRHQYTPERAFQAEFPLGCLLDSANPTRASQSGSIVVPLARKDAAAQVNGPSITIGGGPDLSEVALRAFRVTVGSDPERADVVLARPTVAPLHAYFFVRRGRLHIADGGSPHGTFVAGQRLRPMQRLPLRPDSITEVWFGEEGFFHFDAKSLYSYVHYLLGTHESRPRLNADMASAPAGPLQEEEPEEDCTLAAQPRPEEPAPVPVPVPAPVPVPVPVQPAAALQSVPGPQGDPWASGLTALRRLRENLKAVHVVLERAATPIPLFDGDAGQDLEVTLQALEGMRPLVTRVQAHLRRSGFALTVFQRGGESCSR